MGVRRACVRAPVRRLPPAQSRPFTDTRSLSVMSQLTLDLATRIVDAALDHAATLKLHPLSVAVLDAGGHLVAFKRQDHSGILRFEIAFGKAWGALGMGFGSRTLAGR